MNTRDNLINKIPSEILEPYLQEWCKIILELIMAESTCPSPDWWEKQRLKASGVGYLLQLTDSIHASIAFSREISQLIPLDPKAQNIVWETARSLKG